MARSRLTRKEMKQPDRFLSLTVRSIEWVKTHTAYLLYGGLGVVVVIGLIVGWTTWQRHREHQAELLLYQAIKELPSAQERADGEPDNAQQLRAEAQQQLQTVTHDYPGTRAAGRAFWHLGHLYFEAGDYQAALVAYHQARQRLDDSQLGSTLVRLNVSNTYEALGACDQAVIGFEAVVQSSATWLHGEAYQGLGRCYEAMGELDEALATYERALADPTLSGMLRQQFETHQARLQDRVGTSDTEPASSDSESAAPTPQPTDEPAGATSPASSAAPTSESITESTAPTSTEPALPPTESAAPAAKPTADPAPAAEAAGSTASSFPTTEPAEAASPDVESAPAADAIESAPPAESAAPGAKPESAAEPATATTEPASTDASSTTPLANTESSESTPPEPALPRPSSTTP